jgi:hypothetical protein
MMHLLELYVYSLLISNIVPYALKALCRNVFHCGTKLLFIETAVIRDNLCVMSVTHSS